MPEAPAPERFDPRDTAAMRELFWQNVIREILTSLSMVAVMRPAEAEEPATADAEPERFDPLKPGIVEHSGADLPVIDAQTDSSSSPAQHQAALETSHGPRYEPELFDGRLAVILKSGERVAIGDVFPLFACGVNNDINRPLAMAVQCSVFQIRTPEGQVFTIPLHEVRAFHALSPQLMQRLMESARAQNINATTVPEQIPFGFAAFTSLVNGRSQIVIPEAPLHPTE